MLETPLGVGTGNTEAALVEQYKRSAQTKAEEKKLNAHNQWLQMGAEFGWLGLVLCLALFASILHSAYQQEKWLMLGMIGVFAFNCLVESMLEVQAGIVFFGLLSILIGPATKTIHR
jgi:O-antigen ligase